MSKRKWTPELGSWVLVRQVKNQLTGAMRLWKDASPALVSQTDGTDKEKDEYDDSQGHITVLFPNLLVMQHGWTGPAYSKKRVPLADIRPYEGPPRHILTDRLLSGFKVVDASTDFAWTPIRNSNATPQARKHGTTSSDLVWEGVQIQDFAGLLAEYLWSEAETSETEVISVSAQDCLPLSSTKSTTHSVPIRQPLMFQLMRTSKTMCKRAIAGIEARSRTVCEDAGSLRYASIILGVIHAAFPTMWKQTIGICARPATDEEMEKVSDAQGIVVSVHRERRKSFRAKLAEAFLDAEEADLKRMWDMTTSVMSGAGSTMVASIANIVVEAFSQGYTIDPYIVGVPISDVVARMDNKFSVDLQNTDELRAALMVLHKSKKLILCGDLIFPL